MRLLKYKSHYLQMQSIHRPCFLLVSLQFSCSLYLHENYLHEIF